MLCGMGGQSMMHNYGQRVDDNNLVSLHPHPQNCGWESKLQHHLLSGVVIYHNSIISKLGFLAISHQPHQVGFVQHLSQS